MMRNLLLDEGEMVNIESVSLPVATYSKFEPQNVEFLDITNPKAVLENALRNFACLTTDDVIAINYVDKNYEIRVLEVKPGNAVTIIECDMNVEFAAPVGYQEPTKKERMDTSDAENDDEMLTDGIGFYSFQGSGNRLDGKKKNLQMPQEELKSLQRPKGIPDYDYEVGFIKFWRKAPKVVNNDKEEEEESFEAFHGDGTSLRQAKARK